MLYPEHNVSIKSDHSLEIIWVAAKRGGVAFDKNLGVTQQQQRKSHRLLYSTPSTASICLSVDQDDSFRGDQISCDDA